MHSRLEGKIFVVIFILCFVMGCKELEDRTEMANIENGDVQEELFVVPEIVYDELLFKESCEELVFNEVGEDSIGKFVTKELTSFKWNYARENGEVVYSSVNPEDAEGRTHTYSVYGVVDCRFSNQYEPQYTDVFRVYGIVEDTFVNNFSGADCPIIRVYYADYVRQSWEDEAEIKELEEVIADREEEAREIAVKHATISDYTGVTKNIEGMWELPMEEYKQHCDSMCLHDVMGFDSDLSGLHVKLHVKTRSGKKFAGAEYKLKYMDKWGVYKSLHDNVWSSGVYNEFSDSYVTLSMPNVDLYFCDSPNMDVSSVKEDKELIVYGQIVEYDMTNKEVEMLVRCYEEK